MNEMLTGMSPSNLYRVEVYIDPDAGKLACHFPINEEGDPDIIRQPIFYGETVLSGQNGPMPVSFEIPAVSVTEALSRWLPCLKAHLDKLRDAAITAQTRSRILSASSTRKS